MVTSLQPLSDRLGKGNELPDPSRSSKTSFITTLELIHTNACFKSELHFKREKNHPYIQVSLIFLSDGYWRLLSNKMTHIMRYLSTETTTTSEGQWIPFWAPQCQQCHPTPSRDRFCTGCRQWERISGSSSYFANSWNLVILSLEKDLADIYNGRLESFGGETDGGLLILHTVKNYMVAPAQLQHEEKTNQHGNTCREEGRTKGNQSPWRFSHHGTTQKTHRKQRMILNRTGTRLCWHKTRCNCDLIWWL